MIGQPLSSDEGLLKFPHKSLTDNLHATILLSNLYYITEKALYKNTAERILQFVLGSADSLPVALTGNGVKHFLQYPVHIVVVGSKTATKTGNCFKKDFGCTLLERLFDY